MHARKPRYDESFVDKDPASRPIPCDGDVQIVGGGNADYVPSPARELQQELQQELQGRLQASPPVDVERQYSGRTNILVIGGASILLWAGLLAIGMAVLG